MNGIKVFFVGLFVVLLVTGFSVGGFVADLYNQENTLKQQIVVKQKNNQSEFDNMWKKIKQTTNCTDKYKDGFVEALTAYAEARSAKGASGQGKVSSPLAINAVQEAIPNLSDETYKQLNNLISSSRDRFTEQQKQLLDLEQEHNILVTKLPNVIVFKVLNIGEIHTTIVTSSKTEKSFATGKDDDTQL